MPTVAGLETLPFSIDFVLPGFPGLIAPRMILSTFTELTCIEPSKARISTLRTGYPTRPLSRQGNLPLPTTDPWSYLAS